jgi:hypothetical protein
VGKIKKVLSEEILPKRNMTATAIWGDLCENIHLHFRNIRLDFSIKEWAEFVCAIHSIQKAIEYSIEQNKYEEGNPNFLVQTMYNFPLKADTDYYPNRSTIEIQKDNTAHFHYRDLRLHWSEEEFIQIAEQFTKGYKKFKKISDFPYSDIKEKTRLWIDIDLIQPYDEGHKPLAIDKHHREGIDVVKKLIKSKKKIRPILVDTSGQRLDGFKRYMAHKELKKKQIECYIDPFGVMGGQHDQNFEDDE